MPESQLSIGGCGGHEGDIGSGPCEAVYAVYVRGSAGEEEGAGEVARNLCGGEGALDIEGTGGCVENGLGIARGAGEGGSAVVGAGPLGVGAGEDAKPHVVGEVCGVGLWGCSCAC